MLDAAGAKGTFFFNGNNRQCIYSEDNVKRVRYAYNRGHQVASHTWGHKDLKTLTWDQIHDEMWRVEQALDRIVGAYPAFMRPPYGSYDQRVIDASRIRGQAVVIWDMDSRDSLGATVQQSINIYQNMMNQRPMPNGNILTLNHETIDTTVFQVIPEVLKRLKQAGYRMVTLAECLGKQPYQSVKAPQERTVCVRLDLVTRERVLWYNLIRNSRARFTLTRRIHACSSQELEDAFIRTQKASYRWSHPNPSSPPRTQRVDLDSYTVHDWNAKLLPGGRWLLKLKYNSELIYADMNAVGESGKCEWRTLVPRHPQTRLDHSFPWAAVEDLLDINGEAEYLTFNIPIAVPIQWERGADCGTQFKIWRCTAEFDDEGYEVGIYASLLSSFDERCLQIDYSKISLRGDFVAYASRDNGVHQLVVVDWKLANGHTKILPRYLFPQRYSLALQHLIILPDRQLLSKGIRPWEILSWNHRAPTTAPPDKTSTQALVRATSHPPITFVEPPAFESLFPPFIWDGIVSFIAFTGPGPRSSDGSKGGSFLARYSDDAAQHMSRKTSDSLPSEPVKEPNLENLPLDVLLEVMILMEWHELLRIRQVCMRLNLVTRQRVLWNDLIRNAPSRFTLTKRMHVCSSQELEDAFLRTQKASYRWTHPDPSKPPRTQQLLGLDHIHVSKSKLLPGGRWLVKLKDNSELLYADMNSVTESGECVWRSLLAPDPDTSAAYSYCRAEIEHLLDIDGETEYLTFNIVIAVPMRCESRTNKGPDTQFNVWRCTAEFDQDGYEIGLSASLLSSFDECHLEVDLRKMCLMGDFVAYSSFSSLSKLQVIIVDWKLANGRREGLSRYLFPQRYDTTLQHLVILPNRQLLCKCMERWDILDWSEKMPTTKPPDNSLPVSLANTTDGSIVPPIFQSSCPPFMRDGVASFIVCTHRSIACFSFTVPNPATPFSSLYNTTTTILRNLNAVPARRVFACTPCRAILRLSDTKLVTATFNENYLKDGYSDMNWSRNASDSLPSEPVEEPSEPNLENLPLDILLQVMALLEWHELLRIRQVCARLDLVTRERVLWYNLIQSSPARFTLTKRTHVCSSQELEDAFIRTQKRSYRWTHPNPISPPRTQRVDLQSVYHGNAKLLPGGRWLLKFEHNSALMYTDMNAVTGSGKHEWRTLVAPHPKADRDLVRGMAWAAMEDLLDIDGDAEYLAFNILIAVPMRWETRNEGVPATQFNIWRCASDFDDNGYEIGLCASLLSSFEERQLDVHFSKISLRGDFIAYTSRIFRLHELVVVDWKLANGHTKTLSRYLFPKIYDATLQNLIILPNRQLLCKGLRRWDIHSWNHMEPTTEPPDNSLIPDRFHADVSPTSTFVDPPSFRSRWPPFIWDDAISFVTWLSSESELVCFVFRLPNPTDPDPSSFLRITTTILQEGLRDIETFYSTPHRALLRLGDSKLVTATYNVDRIKNGYTRANLFEWDDILTSIPIVNMFFDDVSCRCILAGPDEHYLLEFD
ncbi:hypothetical protein CVT24_000625 [Panaeolus cyanescens]|uniref:Uncharacterized protein n=1 Tax=Panaeolus cyanescens TaxID=181874 RepID=A0A409YT98_9AGAR|nr:hypothetical protein CVT24_000625 [Panaeolus cyanescens]